MDERLRVFGTEFLQYTLCVANEIEEGGQLSPAQEEAAQVLLESINKTSSQDPLTRWLNLTFIATEHIPSYGMSRANVLRAHCGGELQQIDKPSGRLAEMLLTFGRDAYPGYLIKEPETTHGVSPMPMRALTAARKDFPEFCREVLSDEKLKELFPGLAGTDIPDELSGILNVQSLLSYPVGGMEPVQLLSLADDLIKNSFQRCQLDRDISTARFLSCLSSLLEDARSLAAGDTIDVPIIVGLGNVAFEEGMDLAELSYGLLRARRPEDAEFDLNMNSAGVVLVCHAKSRVLSKRPASEFESFDYSQHSKEVEEWHREVRSLVDSVCLGLMLASPGERPGSAFPVSISTVHPFSTFSNHIYSRRPEGSRLPPITLTEEFASQADDWINRVIKGHPQNLRVAMRRVISAAGTRSDPVDSLVDAVLAWENMFSSSPETKLRVCGSLAILLEDGDYEARNRLYGELGKIYNTRSAIVHGKSKEPSHSVVANHRDRAIVIALQAFRKLYGRPQILNAKDSDSRGQMVMLGASLNDVATSQG
ncbi:HEPN domain-containing protein [Streptomyces sp. NBC_01356]|uniref:hypothetical protein n=1 Tax=Streptomyces sp. NBC_01356 TaxID=2903836 RepID=UPI002E311706|nr:hypothetical protein [Streptomyces sp. NBC_01356]